MSDPRADHLASLMHYYHDCVAAQLDWSRAVNVVGQAGSTVLGLTLDEQQSLGRHSTLQLKSEEACELAKRVAAQGADTVLSCGALFLVGQLPRDSHQTVPTAPTSAESGPKQDPGESTSRSVCAPLLTTPVSIRLDLPQAAAVVQAEERELSINYGLVAELLGSDEEGMTERLQELARIVPDFPIEDEEFDQFWRGFTALATDLPINNRMPLKRGSGKQRRRRIHSHNDREVRLCDFYLPQISDEPILRLLPATALVLSRRKGPALTMLSELEKAAEAASKDTALRHVFVAAPLGVDVPNEPVVPSVDAIQGQAEVYGASEAIHSRESINASDTAPPNSIANVLEAPEAPEAEELIRSLPLPRPLTETQAEVVRSARTAPLTVVTGPPGTGKSYTIVAIVLDAIQSGQTVLVASHMDKAVSVVAEQVEQLLGESAIAQSGGRQTQRELANKLKRLTGPRSAKPPGQDELARAEQSLHDIQQQLKKLEQRFLQTVGDERRWSGLWESIERLEPICPLPVLDIPPQLATRAERTAASARRNHEAGWLRRWWAGRQIRKCRQWMKLPDTWDTNFDELDELFEVLELRQERNGVEQRLHTEFPADRMWDEIRTLFENRNQVALQIVRLTHQMRLAEVVQDEARRHQLRQLAALLRRRRHDLKKQLRAGLDPRVLLWGFPVWAATNRSLGEVLPPTPGLFDLVVIDEASQCDPATAATALMRGRRAVVVGDPAQLRHVSFLGKAREQAAVARVQLSATMHQRYKYRRSLFDVAADAVKQANFFMLREHFRSHPQIIHFSNHEFYNGELQLMTARPSTKPQQAIQVISIAGARRPNSSINDAEVTVVVQRLRQLMDECRSQPSSQPSSQPLSQPLSLGVVSPFRDHVDAIFEQVMSELTAAEVARHELVIGTAHALQGDEKDIVILTTSIDSDSHPASLRFLQSPHLLNVALTRARQRLEVVTSVSPETLPPGLLKRFLEHAGRPWEAWSERSAIEILKPNRCSPTLDEMQQRLAEQSLDTWPQFRASGEDIDMVVGAADQQLIVMVDDADPGLTDQPLASHYRLHRAGWDVLRIPHRTWANDWHACVTEIQKRLR